MCFWFIYTYLIKTLFSSSDFNGHEVTLQTLSLQIGRCGLPRGGNVLSLQRLEFKSKLQNLEVWAKVWQDVSRNISPPGDFFFFCLAGWQTWNCLARRVCWSDCSCQKLDRKTGYLRKDVFWGIHYPPQRAPHPLEYLEPLASKWQLFSSPGSLLCWQTPPPTRASQGLWKHFLPF